MLNKFIVITSINPLTRAMAKFADLDGWTTLVVGDKKSAAVPRTGGLEFLSVEDQHKLGMPFVERCPYNHYGRKNIGYLFALKNGAHVIYDTDDDNIPYDYWYEPQFTSDRVLASERRFTNVYSQFSSRDVWPRGYPLDEIRAPTSHRFRSDKASVGVWQGLADMDPDVDAIYRLLNGAEVNFERGAPFALARGLYSPFNSQNTFWQPAAFAAMYLPMTVRFRFTDILRGYVAQRLLWENELSLGVMEATVFQERNAHDLMKDFADEIDCYTRIKEIVDILDNLDLSGDTARDIIVVYERLAAAGIVVPEEANHVRTWSEEIARQA